LSPFWGLAPFVRSRAQRTNAFWTLRVNRMNFG
jgi:hypothetical protein